MDLTSPQFMYMVLILPSLFGLTLVGEGITKMLRSEWTGMVSVVAGVGFMMVIGIAYLVLRGLL